LTEHVDSPPALPDRAQVGLLKLPAEVCVKVTVPVGCPRAPAEVSLTVAVHRVGEFTGNEAGEQSTSVEVARVVTSSEVLPLLELWSVSPP
jgi:hypothetical protein